MSDLAPRRVRRSILRSPALHFVVVGALLFVAQHWWSATRHSRVRDSIVLTSFDVERLVREWQAQYGTIPDAATRVSLIDDAIDEEVLYREAVALRLDRDASIVRERLQRLAGYLEEGEPEGHATLDAEARRLGLERHDVVVRRHLIHLMRMLLESSPDADVVSDADLATFVAVHRAELEVPEQVQLTHIFFRPVHRGDADAVLARLQRDRAGAAVASTLGDPFIRGARIGPASWAEIERDFGADFAAAVGAAPIERWSGPISSPHGTHLVWVSQLIAAQAPSLEAVRGAATHAERAERREQRLRHRLDRLRASYEIQVAGTPIVR